jgi:hypothetical protein
VRAQRSYESDPAHLITVAETLTEPDPMVRRAPRLLRKADERGYHISREHPCLAIHVTTDTLDRTLRIFDALLYMCRARGWAVECRADSPWDTQVTVLDKVIPIGINERARELPRARPAAPPRTSPTVHYWRHRCPPLSSNEDTRPPDRPVQAPRAASSRPWSVCM